MKKTLIALTLAALMLLVSVGCSNQYAEVPAPSASPSPSASPLVIDPIATPGASAEPGASAAPAETPAAAALSGQESAIVAAKCDESISKLSEVSGSVTVLLGDKAITALTFDPAYKGAVTERIVGLVEKCVRSVSPSTTVAGVTSDPAIAEKLKEFQEKQLDGADAAELKKEFDALVPKQP